MVGSAVAGSENESGLAELQHHSLCVLSEHNLPRRVQTASNASQQKKRKSRVERHSRLTLTMNL